MRFLGLATLAFFLGTAPLAAAIIAPIVDAVGDAPLGAPDITRMEAEFVGADMVKFTITFANPVSRPSDLQFDPPPLVGYIVIDIFTNANADIPAALVALASQSLTSPFPAGIDFIIDLFSEGMPPNSAGEMDILFDDPINGIASSGTAFATYGTTFDVTLPLSFLNTDEASLSDATLAFGAIVGDFAVFTDQAAPASTAAPEPASLALWSLSTLAVGLVCRRRLARSHFAI
jgi:hypothetical protein